MTPEARRLVQANWPTTAASGEELAVRFYARLFEIAPDVQPLFASTDMVAQREKLMDMLGAVVRVLDDPDRLIPDAAALGRRHTGYGARDRHYEVVGEALRDALSETLGPAFTSELRDAWMEAYALLSGVMRRAAAR